MAEPIGAEDIYCDPRTQTQESSIQWVVIPHSRATGSRGVLGRDSQLFPLILLISLEYSLFRVYRLELTRKTER